MPSAVTKKVWKSAASRGGGVPQQTIDITPSTATVTDQNPHWSSDESSVLFDSDRATLAGTTVGTYRHIYRMYPDGTTLSAITGPLASKPIGATSSQIEPALNSAGNAVVYIQNTAGTGTDLELGSVDLVELNLATGTTTSLIANNPAGLTFTGLNHPEYGVSPGGNFAVIFAGRLTGHSNFNLFAVDTQTLVITQLTSGIADDRNPTQSPYDASSRNKLVIAFDSNRADNAGTSTKAYRDIWVLPVNTTTAPATRVTDFSVGGAHADNIQPAWSTNKIDRVNSAQQFVYGRQLIAFASTRYDTNNDGNANGINPNGSRDIYWVQADLGLDPNYPTQEWYTVLTPESVTNVALKLNTSDPSHIYNDAKPTWPQFISTYRVSYQSNRTAYDEVTNTSTPAVPSSATPNDIFASTIIDLYAPSLVKFSDTTGDIINIEPRLSQPGTKVKFSVKVADFETGIRGVYIQIKNPNSKYQSSDGLEHKVYTFEDLYIDNSNIALNVPVEYESQRIYVGSDPTSARVNTYADPTYVASVDDAYAFTGGAHPPTSTTPALDPGWLQLTLESRDATTGVATYSGEWTSAPYASDYYVDVIVYDNAVDPFTGAESNWKIYDNIWGFSTQSFNPQSGILFVSDHAEGQKFFGARFGTDALVNVWYTFWGTESWLTDLDINLLPTQYRNGSTTGRLVNVANSLGVKSYGAGWALDYFTYGYNYDSAVLDGTQTENGTVDIPVTQQYDIWRIQCRGPVPDALIQQYTPHTEQQPSDATGSSASTPRTVLVSNRCILWHAPYTGGVYQAPGSITDLSTQAKLQNYVSAGGRLFVSGQDIAWAMTLDGTVANSFLTNVLHATYVADYPPGVVYRGDGAGIFPFFTSYRSVNALTCPTGSAYNPIINDPFAYVVGAHVYAGPPDPTGQRDYIYLDGRWHVHGTDPVNDKHWYGSPGAMFPDEVTAGTGAVVDFQYNGTAYAGLLHYADTATNAKVVYCPMGLEGYAHDGFAPANTSNIIAMKNRTSSLLHNAVCWMRTGVISGSVYDTQNLPISGALVRLYHGTTTAYTALSDKSGHFIMNGVVADGYDITANKAGYMVQKPTFVTVHGGGGRDDVAVRMTLAEKASIKGTVTRSGSTTPVVGATITATEVVAVGGTTITPTVVTTTSDAQGKYILANLPAGVKYTLTCSATGYGESVPVSYTLPDATAGTIVAPATEYSPFDFALKSEQGVVEGTVVAFSESAPGHAGSPIEGAVVTATQGTSSVTATTDASGNFSFNKSNTTPNGLDPGTWAIVATAPGYAANSAATAAVVSGTTPSRPDQDPIVLSPVPPGAISGLVTGAADGNALAGVVIEVRDQAGTLVTSNGPDGTSSTVSIDSVTGKPYNFTLSVPAGPTYVVTAVKTGYSCAPASRSVTVTTLQTTKNIDFSMEPLHTFGAAVSMVSTPYDYASYTAANLLNIGSVSALKFATWDLGQYAYYSAAPANTFRLGRGYWLGYQSNIALSTEGTLADQTRAFETTLTTGWNMIGCPFTFALDWAKIQVRTSGGSVLTYDQAVAQGKIGVALYTWQGTGSGRGSYVLGFTLDPWVGYWVKAYEPVTLLLDPVTSKRSAQLAGASRAALVEGKNGWSLNLRLDVDGAADNDNYIGVSTKATDGADGYKMEEPPVFLSRNARLRVEHSDWGTRSGDYGVDVRSASAGQKTWDVAVDTTVANSTAKITWPNAARVSRGVSLTLTDLSTGTVRDMRSSSGYSWSTGDQPATRRFKITATRTAGSILTISGVTAKASRSSKTYSIGYTLSAAASVRIRVLSSSGSEVRSLSVGTTRAAGVNQATWDLKTSVGTSVPAGMYVIEISAHSDETGQTARGVGSVTVIR